MDITQCPHCHRPVIPMGNGKCPSCQADIAKTAVIPAGPLTLNAAPVPPSTAANLNPYAPPTMHHPASAESPSSAQDKPAATDDIWLSIIAPGYGIALGILASVFKREKKRGATMIRIGLFTLGFYVVIGFIVFMASGPHHF